MNKKLTAAALAATFTLSSLSLLAGCEKTGSFDLGNVTGKSVIESVKVIDASYGAGKILKVGVKENVKGFGYKDTLSNEYDGMEISLSYMIATAYGYDGVEFTTVTAATRGTLLDSGALDAVLATFTITEARKESWDFSTPYYTDYVSVLVNKSSHFTSISDLAGKTVGVSSGSTSAKSLVAEMYAKGYVSSYDADTFDAATFTEVKFNQYDDYAAISTALAAGNIDAFCVDKSILSNWMNADREFISDARFSPQNYGVATKKGSEFSAMVEACITAWLADGKIGELISLYGI